MLGLRTVLLTVGLAVAAYIYKHTTRLNITSKLEPVYDYIIVGAGSSGCVLASRLSEDEQTTVLLLEAGDDGSLDHSSYIPYDTSARLASHTVDWNDLTTVQSHACQAMNDKRCRFLRGKLVGGTSSIDCMTYVRGSRHDYDRWQSVFGCTGWSYADVLPYFIKSEQNTNAQFLNSGFHGTDGPLTISDVKSTSLYEALIVAGMELGYGPVDINGRSQQGTMHLQATASRGRRVSISQAFLHPAGYRSNLHISTLANVHKILFEGKRAIGVEFVRNGSAVQTVRAQKEVIVSAGVIGSAKLLLLSGIGPDKHLKSLKIPVLANLPVGNGLQVPLGFISAEFLLKEPVATTEFKATSFLAKMDFLLFGTGYLSSPCSLEGSLFANIHDGKENEMPNVELRLLNSLIGNSPETVSRFAQITNMDEELIELHHGNVSMQDGISLMSIVLHPKSLGTVRLQSANANDAPVIDPEFLVADEDVRSAVEAVRLTEKFAETNMFKTLGAKQMDRVYPLCESHDPGSNEYWECYIRHTAFPLVNRMAGTCRMGPANNVHSVVDSNLRVIGIEALRVVDASVMPEIVSADTGIASVMIAEKAADLIRGKVTVQQANVTV